MDKHTAKGYSIDLGKISENEKLPSRGLTEKLDTILLNRYLGFPIMILCFTVLFALSFTLGKPVSSWFGLLLDQAAVAIEKSSLGMAIPGLLMDLISNGILRGIGSAVAFFPQMLLFFTFYTLISDTGYSARIAYLMRQPMSKIHMDRRAFTPLIIGFSCSIPAIISTRDIPNRIDRLIVMLVSTFTPCAARIGVILYIAGAFFTPAVATLVMSGLIVLTWLISALISYLIKKRFPTKQSTITASVLPVYHMPGAKAFAKTVLSRTLDFLNKIASVVIISSVLMWFLSTFPLGKPFEYSYAAMIGKIIAPAGHLAGLNWKLIVALIFGFFAKETTLSTLGVLYHASQGLGNLSTILASQITPLSGLSFLVVYMFYTPCVATVNTIRKESKSLGFAILTIIISLLVAITLGTLVYTSGHFIILLVNNMF